MSYLIGISAVPLLQTNKIKLRTGASIYIHAWKSCQNHCVMVGSFVGKRSFCCASLGRIENPFYITSQRTWQIRPAIFPTLDTCTWCFLPFNSSFRWLGFNEGVLFFMNLLLFDWYKQYIPNKDIWDFSEKPNYYFKTSLVPNLCNYKLLLSACQAPVLPKQQAFPITKL